MRLRPFLLWGLALCAFGPPTVAQHLGNVRRTGYVPQDLTPPYRLAWEYRALQKPRHAWREPGWEAQRIDFDYALPVASADGLVCVASSADHTLRAFAADSGAPRWTFFADGPIRLAPAIFDGRVYLSADDGFVYCLKADTGQEVWRFRPDLPDERLLGNEQIISRWPARSGVLLADGKLYTTFGMLSPEGIYVCCLDARDGRPIWINDTSGTRYTTRPHVSGMGGVSPQGYLVLSDDILAVTCGRAPPALFDRRTGKLRYHEAEGDFTGGAWCMALDRYIITPCESLQKEYGSKLERNGKEGEAEPFALATLVALDRETGREAFSLIGGHRAVASPDGFLTLAGAEGLQRVSLDAVKGAVGKETTVKHTAGHFVEAKKIHTWQASDPGLVYALFQASHTILAGGRGTLSALEAETGKQVWQTEVEGQVRELCVSDGRLLASTTAGRVYCFVPGSAGAPRGQFPRTQAITGLAQHEAAVRDVLAEAGTTTGTCIVLGQAELPFLAELARQSQLAIYVPMPDGDLVTPRQALADAGLYGSRITLHRCATSPLPYAPYLADLVVVRIATAAELAGLSASEVYRILRPYGGIAELRFPNALRPQVDAWLQTANVPAAECRTVPGGLRITRGTLPGAGEWTHQYADPGKSTASDERLARLPLKALWFGGPGPAKMVSRHFRAPSPLVIDGRCFVSGTNTLLAMCIYTGRTIWERDMPDLAHWPAAYRGPAVAVDHEAVYALRRLECLRLDPATGKTLATFQPPAMDEQDKALVWEYLAVAGERLVGTLGHPGILKKWWSRAYPDNRLLFALDKQTGEPAWQYKPRDGIDSNAIAIEGGRVYLIDGLVRHRELQRKPQPNVTYPPRVLKALDLVSGKLLWETEDVAPTHNSVWAKDGVVLTTIQPYSRAMEDRQVAKVGGGARAYDGTNGKPLWQVDEVHKCSPVLVNGIAHLPAAYNLHSGQPVRTTDPLSGKRTQYQPDMPRACSVLSASPNLLMSRSGSLGFYDLATRNITYNYPILRASCWINMIPAGGLVVVPEGSSSCVCAYNYKTSMALIHAERQHQYGLVRAGKTRSAATQRLNLGAPGDRIDEQGHDWFAFPRPVAYGRPLCHAKYGPKIGGARVLPVSFVPANAKPETVARYADELAPQGGTIPWLDACGSRLPLGLKLSLDRDVATRYRVTLRFRAVGSEPGTVTLKAQGQTLAADLAVRSGTLVRSFELDVPDGNLTLDFLGKGTDILLTGLETTPLAP
jgi:outer membrane protein assembly factor BamB